MAGERWKKSESAIVMVKLGKKEKSKRERMVRKRKRPNDGGKALDCKKTQRKEGEKGECFVFSRGSG